ELPPRPDDLTAVLLISNRWWLLRLRSGRLRNVTRRNQEKDQREQHESVAAQHATPPAVREEGSLPLLYTARRWVCEICPSLSASEGLCEAGPSLALRLGQ